MIRVENLDNYPRNNRYYGGNAGKKYGITINGEDWMVKFPKSTQDFSRAGVSYTTSPISEFLGSHIYELLGIPVHETMLGYRDGKIICACKDLERKDAKWVEFKEIKNANLRDEAVYLGGDSSGEGTILSDVLEVLETEPIFTNRPDIKERFWDMFVVDAFIRNGDRNNTNWGVYIFPDGKVELIPVYDNGNAFFTSRNDDQNKERLLSSELIEQDAFGTYRSRFLTDDGHRIDSFAMIKDGLNEDLNKAVNRFVSRVDMAEIENFIDSVPEIYKDLLVLPSATKELYKVILKKHFEEGILPFSDQAQAQSIETHSIGLNANLSQTRVGLDAQDPFAPKESAKDKIARASGGTSVRPDEGDLGSLGQSRLRLDDKADR